MRWPDALNPGVIAERLRKPMDAEARTLAPGHLATLSQGITHYEWHGPVRGPVAVCIHGLTTSSYVFAPLAHGLGQMGFRVLTYDLYGRGFSDTVDGPQDAGFFLTQLRDLLEHEGLEGDLTLFGYSMGGSIATAFAAAEPHRMERLVLIAPAGLEMRLSQTQRLAVASGRLGEALMLCFGGRSLRRGINPHMRVSAHILDIADRQMRETRRRGFLPAVLASLRGILSEDQSDLHRAIAATDIPVLALFAETDRVIPLSALGRLALLNRRATKLVIAEATHALPYTHDYEVIRAVAEIVGEHDPGIIVE